MTILNNLIQNFPHGISEGEHATVILLLVYRTVSD
jgi:hypothetical protein